MDKRTFFDNLHNQLADKYQLTHRQIDTIRSFSIGYKKNRKEIAEWIAPKLNLSIKSKSPSKHYQSLLNFVASCSQDSWEDIIQKTEYDK